jgi:hypothetical protein
MSGKANIINFVMVYLPNMVCENVAQYLVWTASRLHVYPFILVISRRVITPELH